jgi:uncharacterized caspase-like protein
MLLLFGLVPTMIWSGPAAAQAPAVQRVALVIGNDKYATAPLANPVRDARAVSAELRRLGFDVVELVDAGKSQMEEAIRQVRDRLMGRGGVGLLYYAGHGLQLNWRNYMVPIDARLTRPQDVPMQTVDLQLVLDAFKEAGNRMNVVVLDACRDNPFGATGRGAGLAPMDAPWGTFLAYSTAPGSVAEDGAALEGNSLYTGSLVQELKRPGARIEDVFKRVRLKVRQHTQGRQIPWESTSLEDEFHFDGGLKAAAEPDLQARETAFKTQKADWDRISESTDVSEFYAYLERYPNGLISQFALSRIEALQKTALRQQADRDGSAPHEWRHSLRHGDRYDYVYTDGYTGKEKARESAVVEMVGDEVLVKAWGIRATPRGFVLEDQRGKYSPPYPYFPPSGLQVGEKAQARTIRTALDGSTMWIDIDMHVVARESITTPLGTFSTFKVVVSGFRQDGSRVKNTHWYDPGWGLALKSVSERYPPHRAPPAITVGEVVARTRGP